MNALRLGALAPALSVLFLAACASKPLHEPSALPVIKDPAGILSYQRQVGSGKDPLVAGRFEVASDGAATIFAASSDGVVSAWDRFTGEVRWRRDFGETLSTGVAADDSERVFLASRSGAVFALNAKDGSVLWHKVLNSSVNTPPAARFDTLVVRTVDGRIIMLEADTGNERWSVRAELPTLTEASTGRPEIVPGGVLVGLDNGRLGALRSDNGQPFWETPVEARDPQVLGLALQDVDGDLGLGERLVYAGSLSGSTVAIDPSSGKVVWRAPVSVRGGLSYANDRVIGVDTTGVVFALSTSDGKILWRQEALQHRGVSKAVVVNNQVFCGDQEGYIHRLALNSGRITGQQQLHDSAFSGPPVALDDAVYWQSIDGVVSRLLPQASMQ